MDADVILQIRAHAAEVYPQECCGLVIEAENRVLSVVKCTNQYPDIPLDEISPKNPVKTSRNDFLIDPVDAFNASKRGKIVAVYHSHPNGKAEFTAIDILASEETRFPYFVVEYPGTGWASYVPKGFQCELVGRPFIYGVYDCFTLVRDYYRLTFGLVFPPALYRDYGWWMAADSHSFYLQGLEGLGFAVTKDGLKKGDVVLIRYRAPSPNHLAVFVGDGFIMHHCSERKSELAPYGGAWEMNTVAVLRHKDLNENVYPPRSPRRVDGS